MKIVWIGAGNVATHLSQALAEAGHTTLQVYSRTMESAQTLASRLGCKATNCAEEIDDTADVYILSVKDAVIGDLVMHALPRCSDALFLHTAGSIPISVFRPYVDHYGVLYPMQTFSRDRKMDYHAIPFFIEASDMESLSIIRSLALSVSAHVQEISSEQRKRLHLAAVFACNFVNHCYALSEELLRREGVDFNVMLPLVAETARKVHELSPVKAQTGPAVRYDTNVIERQLQMLEGEPYMHVIYEQMSKSIYELSQKDTI